MSRSYADHRRNLKNAPKIFRDMLDDLIYWEAQLDDFRREVQANGTVQTYYDDKGNPKHTAPTAHYANMRTAQDKVDAIRNKLTPVIERYKVEAKPKSKSAKDF
jgi:aminoglycoside phosphotransferase family enzyme